ncbi:MULTISPECIES: hypothetical protein [Paenarthrobacter]|uniref:hypothetical protein n=1 Tax=Paenarthrobacter TaxID=1742992 RepID=UPI00037FCF93|nr:MULTISPECIES: hypothetical protein [Paenarthrobacter]KIA72438.1 hypothetical protein ANMWB30_28480 [Arthrobacter sp. MWB30]KQR06495.1 ATP synthase [Arthrobacter sp. Leaf145]SKB31283.1 ATP synthase protein I [Arthrobacter sp. 31Cvi3.1E]BCW11237.1 hypothetical protein NtRootA2_25190 [Arthrobacter sp. NtRootA2]BCW15319.1 hypothetical protein NtRootA4_22980 [Arthrobacter sp. NtRootA4]BCW23654.1 hypothetical protein NtRootC7_25210 [Arthrobacter sp. NtRootC7]BCW27922.1 hypothetical protein NtRo
MASNAEPGPEPGNGPLEASGATPSLWLHLLKLSTIVGSAGLLVAAALAALMDGPAGALSEVLGGLLVMVFFGISLLVGHYVGRNNPSGAIGLFVATYFVKVVGFAVILFAIGRPEWLHSRWFVIGAIVTVVMWQAAELYGFSKARLQTFNDPNSSERTGDV